MKLYSQYDIETGRIIKSGMCHENIYDLMDNVIPSIVDDTKYYINDGQPVPFPDSPGEFYEWSWELHTWYLPNEALQKAKEQASAILNGDCRNQILSGFISDALGTAHYYPSKETDQANLNASVTASLYPGLPVEWSIPFWCELDGVWDYRLHTAAQIQQVGIDGKNAILQSMDKNAQLQAQIQSAETIEQVTTITW